jgi:adenylate kinase family enzyme
MLRVAILGPGGAGKTVLARKLGELLDLPITHLDQLRYGADWNIIPEAEFVAAQRELIVGERWVIDGNSLASLHLRDAAFASTAFVLINFEGTTPSGTRPFHCLRRSVDIDAHLLTLRKHAGYIKEIVFLLTRSSSLKSRISRETVFPK